MSCVPDSVIVIPPVLLFKLALPSASLSPFLYSVHLWARLRGPNPQATPIHWKLNQLPYGYSSRLEVNNQHERVPPA